MVARTEEASNEPPGRTALTICFFGLMKPREGEVRVGQTASRTRNEGQNEAVTNHFTNPHLWSQKRRGPHRRKNMSSACVCCNFESLVAAILRTFQQLPRFFSHDQGPSTGAQAEAHATSKLKRFPRTTLLLTHPPNEPS